MIQELGLSVGGRSLLFVFLTGYAGMNGSDLNAVHMAIC
jgi:hypothetical protein